MANKNRYDFMTPGSVIDPVTLNTFPDPLTFNVFDYKQGDEEPIPVKIDDHVQSFLWMKASEIYGAPYWDDVVLTLNGISHRNLLQPDDILLFPSERSMIQSFTPGR